MTNQFLSSPSQLFRSTLRRWTVGLSPAAVLAANLIIALPSQAVEFPSTGDRGAPSTTAGGGTRDGWCDSSEWTPWSVKALVPENNVSTFAGDQASLWIHMSPGFAQRPAELYIQNADTRERVYQQNMALTSPEEDDILRLSLPSHNEAGELLFETGQTYAWEFAVICDHSDRSRDYVIQGHLEKLPENPELIERLATANLQEQAEIYAEAALWQETLQATEQLQTVAPRQWTELLASVGLDSLLYEQSSNSDLTDSESAAPADYPSTAPSSSAESNRVVESNTLLPTFR
ncbi:MAG: DUF928 domain-containing protein [Cyanobacteria bacterium J06627_28]